MNRRVWLCSLAAALTSSACGDNDELGKDAAVTDRSDAGEPDASEEDSGAADSGSADAGAEAVVCGGETCSSYSLLGMITLDAGCAESALGAEVCGLSSQLLLMGAEPKYLERNAPGAASPGCGEHLDAREEEPDGGAADAGTKGNGRVDLTLVGRTVSLPGCCTKSGFCSGDFAEGKTAIAGVLIDLNAGFGCMDPAVLFRGEPATVRSVPCDPASGELLLDAGAGGDGG